MDGCSELLLGVRAIILSAETNIGRDKGFRIDGCLRQLTVVYVARAVRCCAMLWLLLDVAGRVLYACTQPGSDDTMEIDTRSIPFPPGRLV